MAGQSPASVTPAPGWESRIEIAVLGGAAFVVRHWLAIVIIALIVFTSLALLAPVLMLNGAQTPARLIYGAYHLVCHQEPSRSYFIGGLQHVYGSEQFASVAGDLPQSGFLGSPALGYKMAYCQRDTAMYLAILLASLVFALVAGRWPRLPLWLFVLLVLPIALDGLTQLTGLRESTWQLRTLTGALFGLAIAWLLFPEIDAALRKTEQDFAARRRSLSG